MIGLDTIACNIALHHSVKEIKNFEHQNFLNDKHQNLIRIEKLHLKQAMIKFTKISKRFLLNL